MKTYHSMEYKYKTTHETEACSQCKRPRDYYWKSNGNGFSETYYGFEPNQICEDCRTENNSGRPPLSLTDLNEIRKRGITAEEYYIENGYK